MEIDKMDEKKKRGLAIQELKKHHGLGEHETGGSGHLAISGLTLLYIGKETTKNNTTSFPFSAEICRQSEFGERSFWYSGTITVRKDGTIQSDIKTHPDSGMNTFLAFVPEKEANELKKKLRSIRKELHLDKAQ